MPTPIITVGIAVMMSLGGKSPSVTLHPLKLGTVEAGADPIELPLTVENASEEPFCLVQYLLPTAFLDKPEQTLVIVDDLDRDPELTACGGAYTFVAPSYRCLRPGEFLQFNLLAWIAPPRRTVSEIAKGVGGSTRSTVLAPGLWKVKAEIAVIPQKKVPARLSLDGVALCKYLAEQEQIISQTGEITAKPDAAIAWARRRDALERVDETTSEGRFAAGRYVSFFRELTGIDIVQSSEFMTKSATVSPATLARWDQWYALHGKEIAWDETKGRYAVHEPARSDIKSSSP